MRTAAALTRMLWAAALMLLLGLRLLTPAGFMPAFDRGGVTIVACPDAGPLLATGGHHHRGGEPKKLHQPCPYASASTLGSLAADWPMLLAVVVVAAALLLGRTFRFVERHRSRDRPPSRAPPLPA